MFNRIIREQASVTGVAAFDQVGESYLERARGRHKIDAKEEARKELDLAKAQAHKEGFQAGFDEGFSAGHLEGLEQGAKQAYQEHAQRLHEEFAAMRFGLQSALQRLEPAVAQFYDDAESELGNLATEVVARVLRAELELNPDAVVNIVRAAISEVAQSRSVTVRVNPFDTPALVKHKAALLNAFANLKSIELVDDPRITAGCVVESDHGNVDATLDTTLKLLDEGAA